ncbi:hypothetical protein HN51_032373 [Arachis hypogaea]|uniref:Ankyrin repeat-containing protein BDA1-like n=1 Tax=Arachis duranensis TaxID=130453 RepID=A0A6P4C9Q7_ARADU|nr:ankyrin repeat-containing protein BDA1-like [Arachis duranensis]XP_025623653.1 ankyrin repeat-containing protein BDA1-like [Arachis hypogaea]QHO16686.1 Ankyrin repeat-containing protein family [Arachis hypogaea]
MNETLNVAAQMGDIDLLYKLLQVDPYLLDRIASVPFINTPLHFAASAGQTSFATEIMRLKPIFAWKLNLYGFSPVHLALQNGNYRTVCRFIDINKDLVRVKGREGLTPLHFATKIGQTDLVARFLSACSGSIEDVNVGSETALHIAVKYKQLEALEVLVGWVRRSCHKCAHATEKRVLNWVDDKGNNVLHLALLKALPPQTVRLLIDSNIDLNIKNLEGSTALDIVENNQRQQVNTSDITQIRDMLVRAGALRATSVAVTPLEEDLRSRITFHERVAIYITRLRRRISNDTRNALLVVAILFATSTYEAAINPPGGVYQAEAKSPPSPPPPSSKFSIHFRLNHHHNNNVGAGKAVMRVQDFIWFWSFNTCAFYLSILMICLLMPRGRVSVIVASPLFLFCGCYVFSMLVISPSCKLGIAAVALPCILLVLNFWVGSVYIRLSKKLRRYRSKQEDGSRFSGGNKW